MKLYVPEIGDHLVLTSDWTFDLHAEGRNSQLGAMFGYYLRGLVGGWVSESSLPQIVRPEYTVNYPKYDDFVKRGSIDYSAYNRAKLEAEESCPEFVKYRSDYSEWLDKAKQLQADKITITLPAGTILAVDRIYIRKGAADFSSITFYAKELGEVIMPGSSPSRPKRVKAQRFWAKLEDCNNIEFNLIEK